MHTHGYMFNDMIYVAIGCHVGHKFMLPTMDVFNPTKMYKLCPGCTELEATHQSLPKMCNIATVCCFDPGQGPKKGDFSLVCCSILRQIRDNIAKGRGPFVTLETGQKSSCCANCKKNFRGKKATQRCGRCHAVAYCGSECQRAAYHAHRDGCLAIGAWRVVAAAK